MLGKSYNVQTPTWKMKMNNDFNWLYNKILPHLIMRVGSDRPANIWNMRLLLPNEMEPLQLFKKQNVPRESSLSSEELRKIKTRVVLT